MTIGAIGAALVGAIVALIGLVVSKENKTSEFRQAWIDELRREIKEFLVNFNAIADQSHRTFATRDEKVKELAPQFSDLNTALFAISLRLNHTEKRPKRLIKAANDLLALIRQPNPVSSDQIRPKETELQMAAKDLLKFEWKRVKRGEPVFFVLKWLSIAVGVVLLSVLLFDEYSATSATQQGTTVEAAIVEPVDKPVVVPNPEATATTRVPPPHT